MKRKMFFRLAVVCVMAVSALIACTKDYGSDIQALQKSVNDLTDQVNKLQDRIDKGAVITNVETVSDGVVVTLSDNSTFKVFNGKDGKDGENGHDGKNGTTWKIGDNGNWWADNGDGQGFVDTGMKSKGDKGDQGLQGVEGKSAYEVAKANGFTGTEAEWLASLKGDKGDKGDPGDYFIPQCDKTKDYYGFWLKVDGVTGETTPTDKRWLLEGTLTAVWDEESNTLTIANVEGRDEDDPIVINLNAQLSSLAVIPEVWDPYLGMPQATVYAITPTRWEIYRFFRDSDADLVNYIYGGNDYDRFYSGLASGAMIRFWCILWNSYLGITNQTRRSDYDAQWDCYSTSFNYKGLDAAFMNEEGAIEDGEYVWDYSLIVKSVKDALNVLGDKIAAGSSKDLKNYRQPPVSKLFMNYRVNPAGADLSEYQFSMIDRRLQIGETAPKEGYNYQLIGRLDGQYVYAEKELYSKAEGDNHRAFTQVEATKVGNDQLSVSAAVDYFKYWADKPFEWMMELAYMKSALAWDYQWEAILGALKSGKTNFADAKYQVAANVNGTSVDWTNPANPNTAQSMDKFLSIERTAYFRPAYESMVKWVNANSVSYETIVALEAAKNAAGAEAIVSDYTAVQLRYLYPLWTAYNHHWAGEPVSCWRLAYNANTFASYGAVWAFENDYLVEGKTYDVASHMRFADPYYGRLEDLGFEVDYTYYIYQKDHSQGWHSSWGYQYEYAGYDVDVEDGFDPCGETIDQRFDGWNKVDCTADGKVSVKEDAEDYIGRYVMICADAQIKDNATGKWYNSTYGPTTSGDMATNLGHLNADRFCFLDEFIGHYLLLIVPDSNKTKNVVYDLGDIDYLALTKTFKTPAPLQSQDPRPQEGRDHQWDDALEMDMTGFNNIYTSDPVMTSTPAVPESFNWSFARNAAEMFTVSLNNNVPLGAGFVEYTFTPKDSNYSTVCYRIKWNIVIDWTDTEPILNDHYVLFDEAPEWDANHKRFERGTGTLTETIITPDPATKYTTPNRKDDAFDTSKFPYVDSIVLVKGKEVNGQWKPQSSIKEHIREYGSYLESEPNIKNMKMSINFTNSQEPVGSAKIESAATPEDYSTQEISLVTPYKEHELYRDYVVDITVTLQNGTSKVVKAYIVRFMCPIYIVIPRDIVLETHTTDWCSDHVWYEIRETGSDELLAYWRWSRSREMWVQQVTPYAMRTYGTLFDTGNWGAPVWKSNADPTFGERLKYEPTSGWFYWNNLGTNLQVDMYTTYTVTQEFPGLATLAGDGNITVLSTANSHAAHFDEGQGPEIEPGSNALPMWVVVYDDED